MTSGLSLIESFCIGCHQLYLHPPDQDTHQCTCLANTIINSYLPLQVVHEIPEPENMQCGLCNAFFNRTSLLLHKCFLATLPAKTYTNPISDVYNNPITGTVLEEYFNCYVYRPEYVSYDLHYTFIFIVSFLLTYFLKLEHTLIHPLPIQHFSCNQF